MRSVCVGGSPTVFVFVQEAMVEALKEVVCIVEVIKYCTRQDYY